ncbi:MAG: hypothetical protein KDA91_20070 [Planctomycetaceae bacterium]|nr:hypothetical protein [Planctomycetaceae bacterium]
MPILSKEPEVFPDDLLDGKFQLDPDQNWFAMYTLARREKELVRQLRQKKVSHYLPLAPSRKRSPSGRIRTSFLPLFTGYVFVRGTDADRYEAVCTGCISRCLDVTEPEQLFEDLRRIRILSREGEDLRPEPKPVVGRQAVLKTGAMAGARGIVTKVNDQHRLTVVVRFMQQGASVLIDEADVELLD